MLIIGTQRQEAPGNSQPCSTLPVLVRLIEADLPQRREQTALAVDSLWCLFQMRTWKAPRSDFCRLLGAHGVLARLARVLHMSSRPEASDGRYTDTVSQAADVLLLFSHADERSARGMLEPAVVLQDLLLPLQECSRFEQPTLLTVLKCIKNLSMGPSGHVVALQKAEAVRTLVYFLNAVNEESQFALEMRGQVLLSLYHLCKLNRLSQEKAVVCPPSKGIVPHLQDAVLRSTQLKHVALPMLCDIARASKRSRTELWKHSGEREPPLRTPSPQLVSVLQALPHKAPARAPPPRPGCAQAPGSTWSSCRRRLGATTLWRRWLRGWRTSRERQGLLQLCSWRTHRKRQGRGATPKSTRAIHPQVAAATHSDTLLHACAVCAQVEAILEKPESIKLLVEVLDTQTPATFENLLDSLKKILHASSRVNQALGDSRFVPKLGERRAHPTPVIRVNLLRMLTSIYEHHRNPKQLVMEHNLMRVVERMIEHDKAVLVKEIAGQLQKAFKANDYL